MGRRCVQTETSQWKKTKSEMFVELLPMAVSIFAYWLILKPQSLIGQPVTKALSSPAASNFWKDYAWLGRGKVPHVNQWCFFSCFCFVALAIINLSNWKYIFRNSFQPMAFNRRYMAYKKIWLVLRNIANSLVILKNNQLKGVSASCGCGIYNIIK